MSDWGQGQGWLRPDELERTGCGRDCHCTNTTCRLARELRTRRSQDLTAQEREAIKWLRHDADQMMGPHDGGACRCPSCERHRLALAILDKLIGGKA